MFSEVSLKEWKGFARFYVRSGAPAVSGACIKEATISQRFLLLLPKQTLLGRRTGRRPPVAMATSRQRPPLEVAKGEGRRAKGGLLLPGRRAKGEKEGRRNALGAQGPFLLRFDAGSALACPVRHTRPPGGPLAPRGRLRKSICAGTKSGFPTRNGKG